MNAIWTKRLVDALILIFALALLSAIWRMVGAIGEGKFDMLAWTATSENITVYPLGGMQALWDMQAGKIRVLGEPFVNGFKYAAQFVLVGLSIAALFTLRRVLSRIAGGAMFSDENIAGLRRIGALLLASCAVSVITVIVVQWTIIDAIPPLEGRAIHPSLSSSIDGVENIWLEYDPPVMSLLFAMIAFSAAGAFRSGQRYREDSESVV